MLASKLNICFAFLFGVFCCGPLLSQVEWELPLYFTDAVGEKDTIIIGIAPDATSGTDSHLGEIEIQDQLWGNDMEIRVVFGEPLNGSTDDLWDNPQYKKMYLDGEGNFGTSSFVIPDFRIIVKSSNLPITMHFDRELIGYPSFVNLIQDRTYLPSVLIDWTYQPYDLGHPLHPTFRCMMHHDSIVEDFSAFFYSDSMQGNTGWMGTTIFLENGDTLYTPGFDVYNFTSWSENFYCDRIVGNSNVEVEKRNIFIENPVESTLKIRGELFDIQHFLVITISGKPCLQGGVVPAGEIDVSGLSAGVYIFYGEDDTGVLFQSRFVKL